MGYNQINLNHLRMFIIAAESNSLQEVAKKTGYEVSNVSTNIKNFEQEVGTKLFTRNPLTLTEIGEEIYEKAAEPKELYVVSGAMHIDLYDDVSKIPFDKIEDFFNKNLK